MIVFRTQAGHRTRTENLHINRHARYPIALVRVTILSAIAEFGRGEIKAGAPSYDV